MTVYIKKQKESFISCFIHNNFNVKINKKRPLNLMHYIEKQHKDQTLSPFKSLHSAAVVNCFPLRNKKFLSLLNFLEY
jgi:hypothetical protein